MADIEAKFEEADRLAQEQLEAKKRLDKALGSVASDIEIIANNNAIEVIRRSNPDVDLSDCEIEADIAEARARLAGNIEDAIAAKTADVVAGYQETKTFFQE